MRCWPLTVTPSVPKFLINEGGEACSSVIQRGVGAMRELEVPVRQRATSSFFADCEAAATARQVYLVAIERPTNSLKWNSSRIGRQPRPSGFGSVTLLCAGRLPTDLRGSAAGVRLANGKVMQSKPKISGERKDDKPLARAISS